MENVSKKLSTESNSIDKPLATFVRNEGNRIKVFENL